MVEAEGMRVADILDGGEYVDYESDDAAYQAAGSVGPLGELADKVYRNHPEADGDFVLMIFMEWVEEQGFDLWPHQEEAALDLMCGDHVILGTPTGSGKSMVALALHFKAMCLGEGVTYYTAPIKALVSEKFFNLVRLFGKDYVGMITGDASINPGAPIICCTAEILANRALSEGEYADIASVAMDEFHFFGDRDRGWAWQVPLLTLPNTQFLLMSATLGDTSRIAEKLEEVTGVSVSTIADAPRPVPLEFEYVDTALEGTVELALREGKAPIYIVHFSQKAALASAQALASFGVSSKDQREQIKQVCKGFGFTTAFGKTLQRLLNMGVGVHHAGMLPRYRLLVEELAQKGLLPVICGTDTLGVGINVPIHTVLLTALSKYDGHRQRILNAREFHQIAGRAGRSGFDTEGEVIVQAPEHEIENAKMRLKCAGDKKKLRKLKLKQPREGAANWNKNHFDRLVAAKPEALKPRLRITFAVVLNLLERGGDVRERLELLIESSLQASEEKTRLIEQANQLVDTLINAGILDFETLDDGTRDYFVTEELPSDFALYQPLAPFMIAALELLDPESPQFTYDVLSMVEAILENPGAILSVQEKKARNKAWAEMRADGVDNEERLEKIEEVTYPKPLDDLLQNALAVYCEKVPWAIGYELHPKSILREMVETGATFKGYVSAYNLAFCEGVLLRYLSEAFRVMSCTVPMAYRTEHFEDILAWLGMTIRTIDSSLMDEWESAGEDFAEAPPADPDAVVVDRHGLTVLVRNALFARVRLAAADDAEALGALDGDWGYGEKAWRGVLDEYWECHEELLTDGDARSTACFEVDESKERSHHTWHVRQLFLDEDRECDFRIEADVDLDATQEGADVVFRDYFAGSFDEYAAGE